MEIRPFIPLMGIKENEISSRDLIFPWINKAQGLQQQWWVSDASEQSRAAERLLHLVGSWAVTESDICGVWEEGIVRNSLFL